MHFNSKMRVQGYPLTAWSPEEVKNEPMLFNCDEGAATQLGGPITREFLERLSYLYPEPPAVIDTRVHMLMPGWFPCIPGFHHDDVARTRADGQPNYADPKAQQASHAMALINGDICPTEFAIGECDLEDVPPGGGPIYKKWHREVEALIAHGELKRVSCPSNIIIDFDCHAFHQGVRAVKAGWRWFGRASWGTDRTPTNEVRKQVQVYLEYPMEGW